MKSNGKRRRERKRQVTLEQSLTPRLLRAGGSVDFPILESFLEHDFGGVAQPVAGEAAQGFADRAGGFAGAEVDVGGFPAHAVEKRGEVFVVLKLVEIDPAAVGAETADEDAAFDGVVRIGATHGGVDGFFQPGIAAPGPFARGPEAGGRGDVLGLAGDEAALPGREREEAAAAEAAEAFGHFVHPLDGFRAGRQRFS